MEKADEEIRKNIASALTRSAPPIPPRAPLRLHQEQERRRSAQSRASRPATPKCYKYKYKYNEKCIQCLLYIEVILLLWKF